MKFDEDRVSDWKLVEDFYIKLWELHDSGALPNDQDDIAIKIINAIDEAMGR
jgi:hypothetical protein